MQQEDLLSVVCALVEQPTAPFHEEAVRDAIVAQLQGCPNTKVKKEAAGYAPLFRKI